MNAIFSVLTKSLSLSGAIRTVERQARKEMADALAHAGARVRLIAQQSITRKKGPSAAGDPPHGHGKMLLRNKIFFDVDMDARGGPVVIIGPAALADRAPVAPGVLEFGGTLRSEDIKSTYRPDYTASDFLTYGFGPVAEDGGQYRTWTALGPMYIPRGRIRTARQAERANRIYHQFQIGARPTGQSITIAARPYMNPALEAALPRIVEFIAGAA